MPRASDSPHLPLFPLCGACGDVILEQECTILILGHEKKLCPAITRPFPFPAVGLPAIKVNGFLLCRNPTCKTCAKAPESVAIHSQCFKTFTKEFKMSVPQVLEYLWTIAYYRQPWSRTPHLGLMSCHEVSKSWLARIPHDSDLAGLRLIPAELLDIIKHLSPHAYLWRFVSILACTPRPISAQLPQTVALGTIESWKRGDQQVVHVGSKRPIMRIKIDSEGIQAIERLPELPKVSPESSRHLVYIVEDMASYPGVQACVKDGLLRLRLPSYIASLPIWGTPCPPRLGECRFQPKPQRRWQRFETICPESTRGITFLYSMGYVHGVYAHSSTAPCALSLYQSFPEKLQQYTVWVYLPIAEHDRVIGFGTKEVNDGLCIIVRTKLNGDVTMGPQSQVGVLDHWVSSSGPTILAYSETSDRQRFPVSLSMYSPTRSEETQYPVIPQCDQLDLGHITYFSSTPLNDISCTYVFKDRDKKVCFGILFKYKGGGSRAVRQCRVGVDPTTKYVRPSAIYFRTVRWAENGGRRHCGVQVDLECPSHRLDYHSQDEWQCRALSNTYTLQFWFAEGRSMLCMLPKNVTDNSG
ncbi:hypothetical protein F5883DRAFT_584914 [Diaporthe sp. PMI_573]|nr:hypothetical protein F5883DRAFT_584914 [Diaporthaceae sp. PMI_573]